MRRVGSRGMSRSGSLTSCQAAADSARPLSAPLWSLFLLYYLRPADGGIRFSRPSRLIIWRLSYCSQRFVFPARSEKKGDVKAAHPFTQPLSLPSYLPFINIDLDFS